MGKDDIHFDSNAVSTAIANFSIGLCKITRRHGAEDAVSAGSGTLVKLGPVYGLLTAGHVLRNLQSQQEIGLVRFGVRQASVQKQVIDVALAEGLIIGADTFGPIGPDLGFLRLPPVNVDNLKATNSFLDILERRAALRAPDEPRPPYLDAVVGTVAEWTKDLIPRQRSTHLKEFNLLFCTGRITAKYTREVFDLCTFEPSFADDVKPPSSYGGLSGGGLWRIYFDPEDVMREMRLLGVAFYEFLAPNERLHIICHGPKSVYRHLINAVVDRWPLGREMVFSTIQPKRSPEEFFNKICH